MIKFNKESPSLVNYWFSVCISPGKSINRSIFFCFSEDCLKELKNCQLSFSPYSKIKSLVKKIFRKCIGMISSRYKNGIGKDSLYFLRKLNDFIEFNCCTGKTKNLGAPLFYFF